MKINLLPKKAWKQTLWKGINVVSSLALIFNMTMVGVFIAPKTASAITYCPTGNPLYMWDRTPSTGWSHGNISGYFEGEYIPVQLELNGLAAGVQTTIRVEHQYIGNNVVGIDRLDHVNAPIEPGITFNPDRLNFSMSSPTTVSDKPSLKRYTLTFTPVSSTATLYFDALLGPYAHHYPGASLHVSLPDCESKDVQINTNQILYHSLAITKSDNPDQIQLNANTTYTITATNNGKTDGGETNFTVTDTLPAGMSYVNGSATPAPTSVIGQVITWNFGTVTDGTTKTITFQATGNAVGKHKNSASVTADGATPATDTETTKVLGQCNLTITKSVVNDDHPNGPNVPGDRLLYILNFSNSGSADCTGGGVHVDDAIPTNTTYTDQHGQSSNVTFGYAHDNFGTANPNGFNGSLLSWNAGTLSPQESGWVKFEVTVRSLENCEQIDVINKGKIYADQIPNGIWSNEVSTHFATPCYGSLKVTKYVDNGSATPDQWSFTTNNQTLTPAQGQNYVIFQNLTPGQYTVTESNLTNYHQVSTTCTNVNVTANQQATCNFHNTRDTGDLRIKKYNDLNGNGQWNEGEPLLPGWHFVVTDHDTQTVVASGDTDVNGSLLITDLPTGYYDVTETLQDGWINTTDLTQLVHVVVSDNPMVVTFGNFQKISISGMKFHDLDGNGLKDAEEPGLADWTIFMDQNSNDTFDIGEASTTTDVNGNYTFSNLGPGTYTLREVQQSGWTQTTSNPAGIVATSGMNINGVDFGNFRNAWATACKFIDADGNIQTTGDQTAKAGWTVHLSKNGQTIDTQVTDENGCYTWNNLLPGFSYDTSEEVPAGWTALTPTSHNFGPVVSGGEYSYTFINFENINVTVCKYVDVNGDQNLTEDPVYTNGWPVYLNDNAQITDGNGCYIYTDLGPGNYNVTEGTMTGWLQTYPETGSYNFNAVSGQNETFIFGNYNYGRIWGYKYNDVDASGSYTDGDQPLNNWNICLGQNNCVTTGSGAWADGYYEFTNLPAGTYTVSETAIPSWIPIFPEISYSDVYVSSGSNIHLDFFNFHLGKISGYKYEDKTANGPSGDDQKQSGWEIKLWKNGNEVNSKITDSNGYYEFTNLGPGTYTVTEVQKTGWIQTYAPTGDIVITSGANITDVNFGNYKYGKISGYKYEDKDGDGNLDDSGNTKQDGWTICLDANTCVVTGAGDWPRGYYEFTGLMPGTYTLTEVLPDGWTQTHAPNPVIVRSGTNSDNNNFGNFKIPKLTVIKHVINNNGGQLEANNFTMNVFGNNVSNPSFPGDENGTTVTLNAGDYWVNEDFVFGYAKTLSSDCSGEIYSGDQKTCTITNDDIAPKLKLVKTVINNDGGDLEVADFPLYYNDNLAISDQWNTVTANVAYTLSEDSDDGYVASTWGGDCDSDTITLQPGDEKICTITNDDIPGRLDGYKYDQNEHGLADWQICRDDNAECTLTDKNGYFQFKNVPAGTHSVTETMQYGWQAIDPATGQYPEVEVELNKTTSIYFVNQMNEFEVSIEKSAPATVNAGDQMTYTLNWTITGNTTVHNVTITDAVPANTTFVSADMGGTENSGTITWNLGDKNPGDSGTVTFVVKVASPLANGTVIDNTAQICGEGELVTETEGLTQKCDEDSTTTITQSAPVLGLEKTNDKPVASPGDIVNYTIRWTVDGNSQATNVTLTDTVPSGEEVIIGTISDGGTYNAPSRTITWNLGTQFPHAEGAVTYSVKLNSPLANGTTIVNIAKLMSDETDPVFVQDDSTVTVQSGPILTIDKTVNITTFVNPGATVNYTVTIKNTGTDAAVNVQLIDLLPAGFTFTDFGGSSHTFNLGNLAAGAETSVTYKVTIGAAVAAGIYDNLAVASADNHGNVTDKVGVEVKLPTVLGEEALPKLVIEKSVDKTFINPGDSATYKIKITNTGDAPAVNVQLQDVLPAGFTFENKDITKVWVLGDIVEGASVEVSYKAISDKTILPGTYENLAVAWADNHDKISDSVKLEVRKVQVLGAELPKTGATPLDLAYFFVAGMVLIFSLFVMKLTISREE